MRPRDRRSVRLKRTRGRGQLFVCPRGYPNSSKRTVSGSEMPSERLARDGWTDFRPLSLLRQIGLKLWKGNKLQWGPHRRRRPRALELVRPPASCASLTDAGAPRCGDDAGAPPDVAPGRGSTVHCVRPRVQIAMVSSLLFLYYSATNCYGNILDVQWRFVCSMWVMKSKWGDVMLALRYRIGKCRYSSTS
jgi:hypothetical protein